MNPAAIPILDGHNDTLRSVRSKSEAGEARCFFDRGERGHLDLPRAREGGFAGGFFAICAPDYSAEPNAASPPAGAGGPTTSRGASPLPALDPSAALRTVFTCAARLFRIEQESQGRLKVVRTCDELGACLRDGVIAAILHIEGAEAIDTNLDALYVLYRAGLRSLGVTWSRPNAFGHGVPFAFPSSPDTGPGLTDAGRALVRACNQLGVLVDLSHLNEKGFWDVASLSEAPLVATHSCAHALCPSSRNLTDIQLDAIEESGGLVGVNFHVSFLRADGKKNADTPIAEIVRHVDHIVGRIGLDHVAFGSDFDGATMPLELRDAAGLPRLLAALGSHGYDEACVRKLASENWLRALRSAWR